MLALPGGWLVVLFHLPMTFSLTSDGYHGCVPSSGLTDMVQHSETHEFIVDRACLELCREKGVKYSALHSKACFCSGSAPTSSTTVPFKSCTDILVYSVDDSTPLTGCHELALRYGSFWKRKFTFTSNWTNSTETFNVLCDTNVATAHSGSVLFNPRIPFNVTRVSDGSTVDLGHMNPYDERKIGIDVSGDGIIIEMEAGDIEPYVVGLKFPEDGFVQTDLSIRFQHKASNLSKWWNPDQTQDDPTKVDGTPFSFTPEQIFRHGFHLFHYPSATKSKARFAFNTIHIRGLVSNLRFDLIGDYYSRTDDLKEATDRGCELFPDADHTVVLETQGTYTEAKYGCSSKCEDFRFSSIRRIGPQAFECRCHDHTNLIGITNATHCGNTVDCQELAERQIKILDAESSLMQFLKSNNQLKVKGVTKTSSKMNICNPDRKVDLAGAYCAHTVGEASNSFYWNTLDLNAPFYPPRSNFYLDSKFDPTDPEVIPNYRRILGPVSFSDFWNVLRKFNTYSVTAATHGVYSHCLKTSQITCTTDMVSFCQDVAILFQKTMYAVADADTEATTTFPIGCVDMSRFFEAGFWPWLTMKRVDRNCNEITEKITALSFFVRGISTKQQILPEGSSYAAPIPGTSNEFVCDFPWTKVDGTNDPFQVICYPYSTNNFKELELCYPPICDGMLPADPVKVPINGTRNWNQTLPVNGTILNTVISYTCPENYAFTNTWKNELDNSCKWEADLADAIWQYWREPGPNMTANPARELPECVPYCFSEFNTPKNATSLKKMSNNVEGQIVTFKCKYAHEFADVLAKEAIDTDDVNDDYVLNTRRKNCSEVEHPLGGTWVDLEPIPESCYIINCTDNSPPLVESGSDWNMTQVNVTADNRVILPFGSTIKYQCTTHGKLFKNNVTDTFADQFTVTCTLGKTWNFEALPHACKWAFCLSPPNATEASKLSLTGFDFWNPPAIGEAITYSCNTSGHNRIRRNYAQSTFKLDCEAENMVSPPTAWPECLSDIQCPAPSSNSDIVHNSDGSVHGYKSTVDYKCVDPAQYIKKIVDPISSLARSISVTCEWDTEDWDTKFATLQCREAACINFPVPTTGTNMEQTSHVSEPDVVYGTKVEFKCLSGQFFADQITKSNHSIFLECLESTKEFQAISTWPTCRAAADCPSPDQNAEIAPKGIVESSNAFEKEYQYECIDQRYSISQDGSSILDSLPTKCQWNNQWSVDVSPLSCQLSHCWDYPKPPATANMVQTSHMGVDRIVLGTQVMFECLPNMYFDDQETPTNRTLKIQCLNSTGDFDPPTLWPTCVEAPTCPIDPPSASLDIGMDFGFLSSKAYQSTYNYACTDPRKRIRDSNGANVSENSIPTTCQWNQKWSFDPSGLACDFVGCNAPPDKTSLNLLNDQSFVPSVNVGQVVRYDCLDSPKQTYFDSDRSLTSLTLICLTLGIFNDTDVWPKCIEDVNCGQPIEAPTNGTISYVNNDERGQDTFGITVEYECPIGHNFVTNETTLVSTCQWNRTWSLDALPTCKVTHCVTPPTLPSATFLEDLQPNEMTPINENRTYHCRHDSSFETDYFKKSYDLLCQPSGSFVEPNWPKCVSTVFCNESVIPSTPVDGSIEVDGVLHTGGDVPNHFKTDISFFCGPSRQFQAPNGSLYHHLSTTCLWNATWSPTPVLDPCVWFQCLAPPIPPASSNLELIDLGNVPTEFHDQVYYKCSDAHWFEHNRDQHNFSLSCQESGFFDAPDSEAQWPKCLSGIQCPPPPGPISAMGEIFYIPPNSPDTSKYKIASVLPSHRGYHSKLRYTCGIARQFFGKGAEPQPDTIQYIEFMSNPDHGQSKIYDFQDIVCQWDKRWIPDPMFDECIWTACMKPPEAPTLTYLKPAWDGLPVAFGKSVTYQCQSEEVYEFGALVEVKERYFIQNRSMTTIDVQCQTDGSYDSPHPWPICVTTKNCYFYPIREAGMTWETSPERIYGSEIKYSCGPLRKFVKKLMNGSKEFYDQTLARCEWDSYYHPKTLDPCQATHCMGLPHPPSGTLLDTSLTERIQVKEFKSHTARYWMRTSPEDTPELAIPADFCHDDVLLQFYLYGTLPSDWNSNFTTISFNSHEDAALFVLQIFPKEKFNNRWVNRFNGDPTFKRGYTSSRDGSVPSTIDLDEPMELSVTCDSQGFYFRIRGDQKYPGLDHVYAIDKFRLDKVTLDGTVKGIEYMAFIPEDLDPKVPVGWSINFECPVEHVLENDYYRPPRIRVTCGDDGTFGSIGWQSCVPCRVP